MRGASNSPHPHQNVLDQAWDSVVGDFHWLKAVIFGEFVDNRPMSAIIVDMLASFLPSVVLFTSARDAVAVIMRMASHPEKREDLMEWVLLCACLITLALPLAMAGAGAVVGATAAGVGAVGGVVVGGIAGSELGAALRAVMLLMIKASTKLTELLRFLQKFMHGNILQFLRAIKFAQYGSPILATIRRFTGKLTEFVRGLAHYIDMLPSTQYTRSTLAKLAEWERRFYAVQTDSIKWVPRALIELDARLAKVLTEIVQHESHVVPSGVRAPVHAAPHLPRQEVRDVPGRIFDSHEASDAKPKPQSGEAPHVSPQPEKPLRKDVPDQPPLAETKANHKVQEVDHPNAGVDEVNKTSRKPRAPTTKNKNIDHSKTTKNADGSTTYYDKQGRPVTYSEAGYPDFSPYSEADVKVAGLKGTIPPDDMLANRAVDLESTPGGYTWHHVEDGTTMQLVPTDIHSTFPHTGGASKIRAGD